MNIHGFTVSRLRVYCRTCGLNDRGPIETLKKRLVATRLFWDIPRVRTFTHKNDDFSYAPGPKSRVKLIPFDVWLGLLQQLVPNLELTPDLRDDFDRGESYKTLARVKFGARV